MKLKYDYDQDPRYGYYRIKVESKDRSQYRGMVEVIVDDEDGGTLAAYSLNTKTGEITPTCMCNAWSESECACGNF